MNIDIMINSASRPDELKRTIESIQKNINFSGDLRWVLHEDIVNLKESCKVIDWAHNSNIFDEILVTRPAQRLGNAIKKLLDNAKTDFIFKCEDDWLFLKKIDLDTIIHIMEDDQTINQIHCSQIANPLLIPSHMVKLETIEIEKRGIKLTSAHEWGMGQGVWRISYIRPRWKCYATGDAVNYDLKEYDVNRNMQWVMDNIGTYWYGGIGEPPSIKHIGINSMLETEIDLT